MIDTKITEALPGVPLVQNVLDSQTFDDCSMEHAAILQFLIFTADQANGHETKTSIQLIDLIKAGTYNVSAK